MGDIILALTTFAFKANLAAMGSAVWHWFNFLSLDAAAHFTPTWGEYIHHNNNKWNQINKTYSKQHSPFHWQDEVKQQTPVPLTGSEPLCLVIWICVRERQREGVREREFYISSMMIFMILMELVFQWHRDVIVYSFTLACQRNVYISNHNFISNILLVRSDTPH